MNSREEKSITMEEILNMNLSEKAKYASKDIIDNIENSAYIAGYCLNLTYPVVDPTIITIGDVAYICSKSKNKMLQLNLLNYMISFKATYEQKSKVQK